VPGAKKGEAPERAPDRTGGKRDVHDRNDSPLASGSSSWLRFGARAGPRKIEVGLSTMVLTASSFLTLAAEWAQYRAGGSHRQPFYQGFWWR
jgi:hypothetical protein